MKRYLLVLAALLIAVSEAAFNECAQDDTKAAAPAETAAAPTPATAAPADMSIYGEVQAVNAQGSAMTVQYYDYDNDEEKSIDITIDSASKLENAKSVADIKKGDWVDVTYAAGAGKNTAKAVSVEKEEPATDEDAPTAEE